MLQFRLKSVVQRLYPMIKSRTSYTIKGYLFDEYRIFLTTLISILNFYPLR